MLCKTLRLTQVITEYIQNLIILKVSIQGESIMKGAYIKSLSCLIITLFSLHSFAANTIRVNVRTGIQAASALGFSVDGTRAGSLGRSFSGRGPANRTYLFGYRTKAPNRKNVSCSSHVLTRNSTVTLVAKGSRCQSIVK